MNPNADLRLTVYLSADGLCLLLAGTTSREQELDLSCSLPYSYCLMARNYNNMGEMLNKYINSSHSAHIFSNDNHEK